MFAHGSLAMLDDIAWLFNLRGSEYGCVLNIFYQMLMVGSIPYNPVFFSYAFITSSTATLYVDKSKVSDSVRSHLGDSVQMKPYNAIFDELHIISDVHFSKADGVPSTSIDKFLISNRTSWALSERLGGEDRVEEARSPVTDAKAVKNDTELAGMRACHIRDGAALSEYFAWLENMLINQKKKIDEVQAADKLEAIRS